MKLRRLAVGSIVLGALATSVLPASGAESGTVNAKVTVAAPCLTLSLVSGGATLDMGTQQFGLGGSFSNFISLTNCAAVAEHISARGTDATSATSATTWALHDTFQQGSARCPSAPNAYGLNTSFHASAAGPATLSIFLSTTDKLMPSIVNPGTRPVDVDLWMPCPGSAGAGETMNLQFIYTASF